MVIWSSGLATFAAVLGLVVGTWISVPAKRIPYSRMKRWHTILGLVFGAVACTWAFSGMLSMDPFPMDDGDEAGPEIARALRGGKLDLAAFAPMHLREVIGAAMQGSRPKQVELQMMAGEPVYVMRESPGNTKIMAVSGHMVGEFSQAHLLDLVAKAVEPAHIIETRLVTDYEAYYLDRHRQAPLPVLFIRLNDPRGSMYYIDPRTARIVASYGRATRWNRWLYHGLHSVDLPWLYKHRPAWDVLVLALLLGGAALCVTSIVLAGRFLQRTL